MSHNSDILKARQSQMRREMDRRGLSLKGVSFDSGIPYSTLLSYFPEPGGSTPALMSVSAQYALCGVIPDDILSLLLPDDRLIVRVPAAVDHDAVSAAVTEYLATKDAAHHPESEAGREIGPGEVAQARSPHSPGGTAIVHSEAAQIKARARRITPRLRAVA